MSQALTKHIARLRAEMARLDQAIQALRDMPAAQQPLREQMALHQVELAALLARSEAPAAEPATLAPRDAEQAARYEQFLATMLACTDDERSARAQRGGRPAAGTGLNLDPLRLAAARGLIAWEAPPGAATEFLQTDLMAAALAPFVLGPLMAMIPGSRRSLSELTSFEVTSLVLEQRRAHSARQDAAGDISAFSIGSLRDALADKQYQPGCIKLLKDLADVRGGLPMLAAAYEEARRPPASALLVLAVGTPFAIKPVMRP